MRNMGKLGAFLRETRRELGKVNWPTRSETTRLTIVVIIFSVGVAAFLGLLDIFFQFILRNII